MQYNRLSRGSVENTKINAGAATFTINQMEEEIKADSELGKKLKNIEKILDENY